jgi:hypothetical protein
MVTKERFEQGLTLAQYVAQMTVNQERFVRALERAVIGPDDARLLTRLGHVCNVLVITEDWCGTSLAYVPFVAKLVAGDPALQKRIFLRDANADLMDLYHKHGRHRSIPVFAFFDADMNELARFLEQRPA